MDDSPPPGISWNGDDLVIHKDVLLPENQCGTCGSRERVSWLLCSFFHDPHTLPIGGVVRAVVSQLTRRHIELPVPLCSRCRRAWDWTTSIVLLLATGGGVPVFLEAKRIFVDDEHHRASHWPFWTLFSLWLALVLAGAIIHGRTRWQCLLIEDGVAVFRFRNFRRLRREGLWGIPPEGKAPPQSPAPPFSHVP
jgi:hypothetical protein